MSSSPTPASTRLATGSANRGLAAPHRARWQSLRARNYLMLDALWVLALVGVVAEWLALGWLTGVGWPAEQHRARVGRCDSGWRVSHRADSIAAGVGRGWLRQHPAGPVRRGRFAVALRADGRAKCGIAADADRYARARWLGRARAVLGARRSGRCSRGWLGRNFALGPQGPGVRTPGLDRRHANDARVLPAAGALLGMAVPAPRRGVDRCGQNRVAGSSGRPLVCMAWHLRLVLQALAGALVATAIVLSSTQLLESFWTGQADLALTAYLSLATLAAFSTCARPTAPGSCTWRSSAQPRP